MKNFKLNIAYLAVFAMIFTSCSKEETGVQNLDSEKATLSFGALLNDLTSDRAATKGHVGFLDGVPDCSEGTAAYVEIILSRDGVNVVGDDGGGNAYRVDLVDGQMFTQEDSELELVPGNYSLAYFAVFTADGTMIWISPMGGSDDDNLSNFVDNPLPLAIDLRAGVKKYVEVDVLCYDDRFVNEYGYLFFEIDQNEAIKFCIFGNYCDDSGKHYPASYSVSVWSGNSSSGTALYTEVPNVTGTYDNGDFYAEPVCFALPDTEGEDEYYFEITLLNSDAYGDVTEEVIRSGVITDADVRALNDGDDATDYYHFREGNCNLGDVPDLLEDDPDNGNGENPDDTDMDGVPDAIDKCENTPEGTAVDADGCPVDNDGDADSDGVVDSKDECPNTPSGTAVDSVGCPVDNDGDADGDGVVDSIDECPNTPSGTAVDAVGCPEETTDCIPAPGAGCDTLSFTQTVDLDANLPVGQDPFYPLLLNGEEVGTITFDLEASGDNNIVVLVDLFEGWVATDAKVSLPDFVNTQICEGDINENDFSINYVVDLTTYPGGIDFPVEVEFSANICQ